MKLLVYVIVLAIGGDYRNRSLVVAARIFVVGEGDPLAVRRNLWIADPIDAVKQHFANGIFETPMPFFWKITDHRHTFAVRGPIRVLYILQNLSWCSPAERH